MQIFPKEIIENTSEVLRFKHKTKSKFIYGVLILSVLIISFSLPFVFLDIYSSATGILKSAKERNQISILYSGKIAKIFIEENNYVHKGDTLIIMDNTIGEEKFILISSKLKETETFIHDLEFLSNNNNLSKDSLKSFLYLNEYLQYAQKIRELRTRLNKTKRDFLRQERLFKNEVIAKIEYENSKYNLDLANSSLNHFIEQKRNEWQSDLNNQKNNAKEYESTLNQYNRERENYVITASINGTVQNVKGIEANNFVASGTVIAEISPDTELIAECYISPSEIGLLKKNSTVKIQIDAFNYNQWGFVTGKVISINKDISILNNVPMFKVICTLNKKHLQLKNGFEGKLIKGMTFKARFYIANRSAYNLLYDKIDDWFTP